VKRTSLLHRSYWNKRKFKKWDTGYSRSIHTTFKFQNKLLVIDRNLRNSTEWARRVWQVFLKTLIIYKTWIILHTVININMNTGITLHFRTSHFMSAFDMHCLPPTMFIRQLWYQYTSTTQKKHAKPDSLHVSSAASYTLYLLGRAYTHMTNGIHNPVGRPGWAQNTNKRLQKMLLTSLRGTNSHTVL
jgi:hypothetical protein